MGPNFVNDPISRSERMKWVGVSSITYAGDIHVGLHLSVTRPGVTLAAHSYQLIADLKYVNWKRNLGYCCLILCIQINIVLGWLAEYFSDDKSTLVQEMARYRHGQYHGCWCPGSLRRHQQPRYLVLRVQDKSLKCLLVFHEERFQPLASSQCWGMITNKNTFLCTLK